MKMIRQEAGSYYLDVEEIAERERPAINTLPEYLESWRARGGGLNLALTPTPLLKRAGVIGEGPRASHRRPSQSGGGALGDQESTKTDSRPPVR